MAMLMFLAMGAVVAVVLLLPMKAQQALSVLQLKFTCLNSGSTTVDPLSKVNHSTCCKHPKKTLNVLCDKKHEKLKSIDFYASVVRNSLKNTISFQLKRRNQTYLCTQFVFSHLMKQRYTLWPAARETAFLWQAIIHLKG